MNRAHDNNHLISNLSHTCKEKITTWLSDKRVRVAGIVIIALAILIGSYQNWFDNLSLMIVGPREFGKVYRSFTSILIMILAVASIWITLLLKKLDLDPNDSMMERFIKGVKMITTKEFNRQKQSHTNSEVRKLQNSQEYKQLMKSRGNNEEMWNWQLRENKKNRVNHDIHYDHLDFNGAALERCVLRMDEEIEDEGGNVFQAAAAKPNMQRSPSGWSSTRSSKKKGTGSSCSD